MGQDPSKFFEAIGSGLQTVAKVEQEKRDSVATTKIEEEYRRLQGERDRLQDLKADLKADTAANAAVAKGGN
jgi:hypothetical protein